MMQRRKILEGLRVVELGQLIAVPYATKLLSDMGAEVIRIESANRPDIYRLSDFYDDRVDGEYWNRAINFNEQNRNKMSLCVELDEGLGDAALKELLSISDVFASNFTPRVMKKYGLEYDDLRKIKPDIIVVSSTGYGHSGPWSSFGAIGFGTEAASGLSSTTGYKGGGPSQPEIPYPDYTAAEHTVFGILSALIYRQETGRGQFISVSQAETVTSTIPESVLSYTANQVKVEPIGNDHYEIPLHGCFRCKGKDDWITIVADSDLEWRNLMEILFPDCDDRKFENYEQRKLNRDELHRIVSAETIKHDKVSLMKTLQDHGVRAGAVLNGEELLFNEHLKSRNFFEIVNHDLTTGIPPLPYPSRPWKIKSTVGIDSDPPPTLGQDNHFISTKLLGQSTEHYEYMSENKIFSSKLEIPVREIEVSRDQKYSEGTIYKYDPNFESRIKDQFVTGNDEQ